MSPLSLSIRAQISEDKDTPLHIWFLLDNSERLEIFDKFLIENVKKAQLIILISILFIITLVKN